MADTFQKMPAPPAAGSRVNICRVSSPRPAATSHLKGQQPDFIIKEGRIGRMGRIGRGALNRPLSVNMHVHLRISMDPTMDF